jgi:hypothetical protein
MIPFQYIVFGVLATLAAADLFGGAQAARAGEQQRGVQLAAMAVYFALVALVLQHGLLGGPDLVDGSAKFRA